MQSIIRTMYNQSLLILYTLNNVNTLSNRFHFISFITIIQTSELATTGLPLSFTEHQLARDTWSFLLPTIFRRVERESRTAPIILVYKCSNNVRLQMCTMQFRPTRNSYDRPLLPIHQQLADCLTGVSEV
jgi:hypothetical protein